MTFDISFSFPFYSQTVWFTGVLLESGELWKENSSTGLRYRKVTFPPLWLSWEGLRVCLLCRNYYLIFCPITHTRWFPYDCSSASLTLVVQESNVGQTYRKRLVSWFFFWCICFTVLWRKLSACPLLSELCQWQMKHCGRWQISIKEAYIGSLSAKAFELHTVFWCI